MATVAEIQALRSECQGIDPSQFLRRLDVMLKEHAEPKPKVKSIRRRREEVPPVPAEEPVD
jgi:hypothetical protein